MLVGKGRKWRLRTMIVALDRRRVSNHAAFPNAKELMLMLLR